MATPAAGGTPVPPAASPSARTAPPPAGAPTVTAIPPREGTLIDGKSATREKIRVAYWRVDQAAKVASDVDVVQGDVAGEVSIGGRLAALQFQSSGLLEVTGDVDVRDRLTVLGTMRTGGSVRVSDLSVEGTFSTGGPIIVNGTARWQGFVEGPGDFSGTTVRIDGGFRFRGRFEASDLRADVSASSSAALVRADTLVLKRRSRRFGAPVTVSIDRIEGRVVVLEGIDAEYVRAERIVIGRDCHLTRVDGRIIRQHPRAHVGPESRSPRPYGLSR